MSTHSIINDPSDPQGFAVLLRGFLEWLLLKNYSEWTAHRHKKSLGYFIVWCEERGISQAAEVTKPILDRHQRWLYHYRQENGLPLSARTKHSRLYSIRAFFRWLSKNNMLLANPASELELPKLPHLLPKDIFTVEEAERVLAQPRLSDPLGIRDRVILELLYSTGMRRSEAAGLRMDDLDFNRGTVMIRQGKGKRDRMIPIGDRALAWITRYLDEVRPTLSVEPDERYLFLSQTGEVLLPDHLSRIARTHIAASGVNKSGACHLFRHTMATLMLENGADTRYIQEMLGHAQLSSTQIYTQVSVKKLKEIHTATHPGARLARFGSLRETKEAETSELA